MQQATNAYHLKTLSRSHNATQLGKSHSTRGPSGIGMPYPHCYICQQPGIFQEAPRLLNKSLFLNIGIALFFVTVFKIIFAHTQKCQNSQHDDSGHGPVEVEVHKTETKYLVGVTFIYWILKKNVAPCLIISGLSIIIDFIHKWAYEK